MKAEYVEQNKVIREVLEKERGTRLEGSFNNKKNHDLLQKVNAGNALTERCRIFLEIMTANVQLIAKRKQAAQQAAARLQKAA